ncbi:hypothetical protein HD553DRAFT_314780 [Filobasidium floriforme]|uniref:uncharacterized protein n=1 Tax=Filobasidium floriforme TaxID=5210 RepID=UPI001E8CFC6D|nr:uncharacterized protein HD553DRAFT_314780 [Filobasidium floriforme]KAH8082391.1 hypothetical protein HD553DRAFT_314780 [Filobasidium floriforme]
MKQPLVNPTYQPVPHPETRFASFREFYPFYLGEHANRINRLMHLLGTSAAVLSTSRVLLSLVPYLLARLDLQSSKEIKALQLTLGEAGKVILRGIGIGYACAWVGHFFVEKNRPATFKYPLMSFMGDLRMLFEVVTLRRSI